MVSTEAWFLTIGLKGADDDEVDQVSQLLEEPADLETGDSADRDDVIDDPLRLAEQTPADPDFSIVESLPPSSRALGRSEEDGNARMQMSSREAAEPICELKCPPCDYQTKVPNNLQRAQIDAIRHVVHTAKWSTRANDDNRPPSHAEHQHHMAFHEIAIVVELATQVGLGGPGSSLHAKAQVVEASLKYLCRVGAITLDGRKGKFAHIFPICISNCCLRACGLQMRAVSRRIILEPEVEKVIEYHSQRAREAAVGTQLDLLSRQFGSAYCPAINAVRGIADGWSPFALHQVRDQLQRAAAAANPSPFKQRKQCFFGCACKSTRTQNLLPAWRGAELNSVLCHGCYKILEREVHQEGVDILMLAHAPPPRQTQTARRALFFQVCRYRYGWAFAG